MAFLNFFSAASPVAPKGLWEWLILSVFSFIANYGWRVVLFTVLLKLLLSPLDIYQRIIMKKNQRITERIKPELEKLQKQYQNNPQALQKKQQELNKREGYKMAAGCLPMIVTLVISIYLLTGLTSISSYKNMSNYAALYNDYVTAETVSYVGENKVDDDGNAETGTNNTEGKQYFIFKDKDGNKLDGLDPDNPDFDPGVIASKSINHSEFGVPDDFWNMTLEERMAYLKENENNAGVIEPLKASLREMNAFEAAASERAAAAAQGAVLETYAEHQEGFLWVKNIWVADVPWSKAIMDESAFKSSVSKYTKDPLKLYGLKAKDISSDRANELRAEFNMMMSRYKTVTERLYKEKNSANGYLVLPILSIAVMIGSQMLTRRMQKKSGAPAAGGMAGGGGKMMAYIMPLMFGIFALFYTAAFSLYMIVNSGVMIIISLISGLVLRALDKKEEKKVVAETDEGEVLRIGRPDPNAPKSDKKNLNPHGAKNAGGKSGKKK
jgi:membrane protein insertase Oxa1/YidC/SpoIIIJ